MKNTLKDLLLYDLGPRLSSVEGQLYDIGPQLMPSFLFFGVLLCLITDLNFAGVLKRAVLCLLAIGLFKGVFVSSVDFGMDIGNNLLSKNNFIKDQWYNAGAAARRGFKAQKEKANIKEEKNEDKSWWFKSVINLPSSDDFLGFFLYLLSNLSLFFVKVTFTLIYYILPLTLPLVALVNILPISSKALEGSILSVVWVGATPIVVALMLEILHAIVASESIIENASFLSRSALGIIFALYLISSFSFSLKLVGTGTIGDALAGPTTAFGIGMATTGLKFIKDKTIGKASDGAARMFKGGPNGEHSPIKSMALNGFQKVNGLRSDALDRKENILDSKGMTANDILGGQKKTYSLGESVALASGTLANPIRSISQSVSRRRVAKEAVASGRGDQVITSQVLSKAGEAGPVTNNGLEVKPKVTKDGSVQYPSQSYSNAITNNYRKPEEITPEQGTIREETGFNRGYRRREGRVDRVTGQRANLRVEPTDPNAEINQDFHKARKTKHNPNRFNDKYKNGRDLDA